VGTVLGVLCSTGRGRVAAEIGVCRAPDKKSFKPWRITVLKKHKGHFKSKEELGGEIDSRIAYGKNSQSFKPGDSRRSVPLKRQTMDKIANALDLHGERLINEILTSNSVNGEPISPKEVAEMFKHFTTFVHGSPSDRLAVKIAENESLNAGKIALRDPSTMSRLELLQLSNLPDVTPVIDVEV